MRVLIVDDEPPARRKLRKFLSQEEDFEVVGEASSGTEAVDAIRRLLPEAVFLDIQMPEMDGFEVLQELHRQSGPGEEASKVIPRIVFVTAYDQFALKAFEVAALDYLLKPYDRQRLRQTLQRLRREARKPPAGNAQDGLQELLGHLRRERQYAQRLVVRSQGRVRFIRVEEIDWIGAAGNYAEIHLGSRTHLLRETLSNLEERLDPRLFVRVHRSAIVNLEQVREIHPYSKNDYVVVLASGEKVRMSRNYRQQLEQAADFP